MMALIVKMVENKLVHGARLSYLCTLDKSCILRLHLVCKNIFYIHFLKFVLNLLANQEVRDSFKVNPIVYISKNNENVKKLFSLFPEMHLNLLITSISSSLHNNGSL